MVDRWIELNIIDEKYGLYFLKNYYKNPNKIFSSSFNYILRRDIWIIDIDIILEKTHKISLDLYEKNVGIMLE